MCFLLRHGTLSNMFFLGSISMVQNFLLPKHPMLKHCDDSKSRRGGKIGPTLGTLQLETWNDTMNVLCATRFQSGNLSLLTRCRCNEGFLFLEKCYFIQIIFVFEAFLCFAILWDHFLLDSLYMLGLRVSSIRLKDVEHGQTRKTWIAMKLQFFKETRG